MFPFDLLVPRAPDRRGREPAVNAWIELHNLVVVAETLDDLGPEHAGRILRQRGVDLREAFGEERAEMYERAVDALVAETAFGQRHRDRLAALAQTLHLHPDDVEAAHQRAFGITASRALADGRLSTDERLRLQKLQHTLGLDPGLAEGAFDVLARDHLLVAAARVLSDGVLSPEENEEMEQARRALGTMMPQALRARLDAGARQWQHQNGSSVEAPAAHTFELLANGSEPVRYAWRAQWRTANPVALRSVLRDANGLDLRDTGRTLEVCIPPAALRPPLHTGRVLLTDTLFILEPEGRQPRGYRYREMNRVRRFQNGVLVELGARALLIESEHDEALERWLGRGSETTQTWSARWRPLRANERDAAFRRLADMPTAAHLYQTALPRLRSGVPSGEWSEPGEVRLRRDKLRLRAGGRTSTLSLRSPPEAYAHDRLVWLVRAGAQDMLFEFSGAGEAHRFAREFDGAAAGLAARGGPIRQPEAGTRRG